MSPSQAYEQWNTMTCTVCVTEWMAQVELVIESDIMNMDVQYINCEKIWQTRPDDTTLGYCSRYHFRSGRVTRKSLPPKKTFKPFGIIGPEVFAGRMSFLSPNPERQGTEGCIKRRRYYSKNIITRLRTVKIISESCCYYCRRCYWCVRWHVLRKGFPCIQIHLVQVFGLPI